MGEEPSSGMVFLATRFNSHLTFVCMCDDFLFFIFYFIKVVFKIAMGKLMMKHHVYIFMLKLVFMSGGIATR